MYGKIFASMYEGSMVGAGPVVFSVWGYCIAKAEQDGTVLLNPILLAPIIGTSRVEIELAIKYLTEPDVHSKNPDHEGRRLLHQSGFLYLLVSHKVYQGIKNGEDRREYMREYMRKKRGESDAVNSLQSLQKLTSVNPISTSTSTSMSKVLEKEVKVEERVEKETKPKIEPLTGENFADRSKQANNGRLSSNEIERFIGYWTETNAKGRCRFQAEKFFDIGRRISTWASRLNVDKTVKIQANPANKPLDW